MKDQQLDKLEQIIKDAQEEIERIKNPVEALPRVDDPEKYFFLQGYQSVTHGSLDRGGNNSDNRHKRGNYFLKQEHAETKLKWELDNGQFIAKSIELADGFKPDWDNCEQNKYSVFYGHIKCEWLTHATSAVREPGAILLPSKVKAIELVKWCNQFYPMG